MHCFLTTARIIPYCNRPWEACYLAYSNSHFGYLQGKQSWPRGVTAPEFPGNAAILAASEAGETPALPGKICLEIRCRVLGTWGGRLALEDLLSLGMSSMSPVLREFRKPPCNVLPPTGPAGIQTTDGDDSRYATR
jgi:hypothetical protein